MIGEKFDTQAVAIYDHAIRKRKTEDMPQVQLIIKLEFIKLWVIVMEWNRVRYVAN